MKWCRFSTGGRIAYGIIEGDQVIEVEGTPFDTYTKTSNVQPLSSVKLEVPVIPPTFYAAGINYPEHITWAAAKVGTQPDIPQAADVGYRAVNALVPTEHPIEVPKDAHEDLQYEGELVAVIGKKCRNVTEDQALDYVLGLTIGNDVSERTWQKNDRTMWRAKNTDTFKPMGPWIVTGLDPDDLTCKVTLSGRVVEEYALSTAIFGVRAFISRMSQYLTLYPGDVLWMGTEGATENMRDGDVIEIEISDIGTLRNTVVWGK